MMMMIMKIITRSPRVYDDRLFDAASDAVVE
jgi:hypothetical protein